MKLVAAPAVVYRAARSPFTWRTPRPALPLDAPAARCYDGSRFDAPDESFRTMYFGASAVAALAEVLAPARERPKLDAIVRAETDHEPADDDDDDDDDDPTEPEPSAGRVVVDEYFKDRTLGVAELRQIALVDVSHPDTHRTLTSDLRDALAVAGAREFDRGVMMSHDRRVTRAIAGHIHEAAPDAAGVLYESRLCPGLQCVALWDGRAELHDPDFEPIAPGHPGLEEAAQILGIELV